MSSEALRRRLDRLKRENYYCIVAMDHGLSNGPVQGITSLSEFRSACASLAAHNIPSAVINIGVIDRVQPSSRTSVVAQIVGMPLHSSNKQHRVALGSPIDAIRLGAEAIALQVDPAKDSLTSTVSNLCALVHEAHLLSLPVLLMVNKEEWSSVDEYAMAIRAFAEIGVDLIKVSPGKQLPSISNANLLSLGVPLLYPGGEKSSDFISNVRLARQAGYSGICTGRNLFSDLSSIANTMRTLDQIFSVEPLDTT